MNDPWTISASTIISLLATALAGISVFIVKRSIDKLEKLDAEAVRKRELKELEERLTLDQREMHGENRTTMKELEERLAQDQHEMHGENRATMSEIKTDIGRLTARIDAMFNRGNRQ